MPWRETDCKGQTCQESVIKATSFYSSLRLMSLCLNWKCVSYAGVWLPEVKVGGAEWGE